MSDYELAESRCTGVAGAAAVLDASRIPRIGAESGRVVRMSRTAGDARQAAPVSTVSTFAAPERPADMGTVCAKHLKVAMPATSVSASGARPDKRKVPVSALRQGGEGKTGQARVGAAADASAVAPAAGPSVAPAPAPAAAPAAASARQARPAVRAREDTSAAPIISVVSASGGTGRSTIALLAAYLCARAGLSTVLIEGDLQFGDYAFWLGLDDGASALGDDDVEAVELARNLHLFKAPLLPEAAEEVSDRVAAALPRLACAADVVIADTGGFWNGLTANLLLSSSLFLMVVDRRPSSIMDAVKAAELCTRIGVPALRMVPVYNRWSPRALIGADEARKALAADDIYCVPEGRQPVEDLLGKGDVAALVESENPAVLGVEGLLADILPRVGHPYCPPARAMRRKRLGAFA